MTTWTVVATVSRVIPMTDQHQPSQPPAGTTGRESWRPQRETQRQKDWRPGQPQKRRSLRVMFCASLLGLEALVLVFYGMTVLNLNREESWAVPVFWASIALAVLALITTRLLTKPVGYWIGWGIQVLFVLGGFLEYFALILGAGFLAAWWWAVVRGGQMDEENIVRDRQQRAWEIAHGYRCATDHPDTDS